MGVLRKMGSRHHWIPQMAAEVLGDQSTHILRIHPNSSKAALGPGCFTHWGQAVLAAQVGVPLPMKRKEISDTNYHFAIINILALIWPILKLMHVLIMERLKFTMVSSKSREKCFLGFEEEIWLHNELHGERASPRCLCPHTL